LQEASGYSADAKIPLNRGEWGSVTQENPVTRDREVFFQDWSCRYPGAGFYVLEGQGREQKSEKLHDSFRDTRIQNENAGGIFIVTPKTAVRSRIKDENGGAIFIGKRG
jgi:hypothetical protein